MIKIEIPGLYQTLEEKKKILKNDDDEVLKKISKLIDKHSDNLTKSEKDFLLKFESKISNCYGLRKIHKSKTILNEVEKQNSEYVRITQPDDLKLRPIVAGPSCPTHRLSNFILLQPFLLKTKSYVRDDIDFLNHLPEPVIQTLHISQYLMLLAYIPIFLMI
jgi:hypothetical protein